MPRTRHVFPTWEWGGPLGEDILCHFMFDNPVNLLKVTEGIVHLLLHHLAAVLPILGWCLKSPHVDAARVVCGPAALPWGERPQLHDGLGIPWTF